MGTSTTRLADCPGASAVNADFPFVLNSETEALATGTESNLVRIPKRTATAEQPAIDRITNGSAFSARSVLVIAPAYLV